jgi:hypothetical protein
MIVAPAQRRALDRQNIADRMGDKAAAAAAVMMEHTLGSKMTWELAYNVRWHEETVVAAVDPSGEETCSQNPELVAVGFGNLNQESHSLYLGY